MKTCLQKSFRVKAARSRVLMVLGLKKIRKSFSFWLWQLPCCFSCSDGCHGAITPVPYLQREAIHVQVFTGWDDFHCFFCTCEKGLWRVITWTWTHWAEGRFIGAVLSPKWSPAVFFPVSFKCVCVSLALSHADPRWHYYFWADQGALTLQPSNTSHAVDFSVRSPLLSVTLVTLFEICSFLPL